ncbi:MAG: type IV pilus secretin PilQ [Rhodoferax sp.]|nr:type IV pilus secretin PilQ [Rhodoferax sp.]
MFSAIVPAQAPISIESVTGSLELGSEVVRVNFSQPLPAVPNGFVVQSPARIALDFPGVASAMGRSSVEIDQGNLNSISVVQAGERSRVVLNLKKPTVYTAEIQGKTLLVTLKPVQAALVVSTATATTVNFAENVSRVAAPLKDIDFRREVDGTGRVLVTLPNNQVGVDLRQDGKKLIVEFMSTSLPEGLRRRMDVTDFATPVKTITTTQVGDRVRMVIEPEGIWEHSAYQSDDQFVVEVKDIKVDPTKLMPGIGYTGQKLSLNFQSIEVRSLLQVIADFTSNNIVASDSVTGSVTLRLQDVPWDQALDIILQAKGLAMTKNGNVIWVAPKDEVAATNKLDFEMRDERDRGERVVDKIYSLKYALAKDISELLTKYHYSGYYGGTSTASTTSTGSGTTRYSSYGNSEARILSPKGSAAPEPRTNKVYVKDVPSRIPYITRMIDEFDIPIRQIMIEARMVEADDTFAKALGARLGAIDRRALAGGDGGYGIGGDNRVAFGTNYSNSLASAKGDGVPVLDVTGNFVNLPAKATNAASFALSIFSASANRFLTLELSALESESKGRVVSSPRVVTANFVSATVEQGVDIPYEVSTASGATSIAFKKASLKLEVKPQITPEGSVILELDVSNDSRGEETKAGPSINTKRIKTQVLVDNGGTVMIGGIYTESDNNAVNKVPFFGDLPVVGHLFKDNLRKTDKKELLVFITPRMMPETAK